MKKINLLLLLFVGALGLTTMSSCTPDEENAKPTISFIAEGASVTADKADLELDAPVLFKMSLDQSIDTKKNIKTLSVKSISNNNINIDTTIQVNKDNTLLSLNFYAPSTYSTAEKFTFTITDNAGVTATKVITLTTKAEPVTSTPLSAATTFTMVRCGGANDPVAYGMKFDAVIGSSPNFTADYVITGDLMVMLTATQWSSLTTQDDLKTAVDDGTAITSFDLDLNNAGVLDTYVATKEGGTYTFVHFTAYSSSLETCGTQYTITADYKQ